MPLFVCECCGTIENTALGFYWCKKIYKFQDESKNGKALCSACIPEFFSDGSRARSHDIVGKWHGKFEQQNIKDLTKSEIKQLDLLNYDTQLNKVI